MEVQPNFANLYSYITTRESSSISPIIAAVIEGELAVIKKFFQQNSALPSIDKTALLMQLERDEKIELSPDIPDADLLLWLAAIESQIKIADLLLQKGACVHTKDATKTKNLLFVALAKDDVDMAKLLINNNIDINEKIIDGSPPIILALRDSVGPHFPMIQLLVESGADLQAVDNLGESPLGWCTSANNRFPERLEVIKLLLNKNADPNFKNKDGCTILQNAILALNELRNDHERKLTVIKLLIQFGARVRDKGKEGLPALFHELTCGQPNPDVIQLLLEKGADPNELDNDEVPPLIHAVNLTKSPHWFQITRLLLEYGANPNPSPFMTILGHAVSKQNCELAEMFLDFGANPNPQGSINGQALIGICLKRHHWKLIKILLLSGMLPAANHIGQLKILAHENQDQELIEILKIYSSNFQKLVADFQTFHMAINHDKSGNINWEKIKRFLHYGVAPSQKQAQYLLKRALVQNDIAMTKLILQEAGGCIPAESRSFALNTLLEKGTKFLLGWQQNTKAYLQHAPQGGINQHLSARINYFYCLDVLEVLFLLAAKSTHSEGSLDKLLEYIKRMHACLDDTANGLEDIHRKEFTKKITWWIKESTANETIEKSAYPFFQWIASVTSKNSNEK